MMSHVPLKALKRSIREASKALRERDDDDDDKDEEGTSTEEEQRQRQGQLQQERLDKARSLSKKKLRRSTFYQSSNLVGEVEELLALHEDEMHDELETVEAALDAEDTVARERGERNKHALSYESRLETQGRFMWQKRFFKVSTPLSLYFFLFDCTHSLTPSLPHSLPPSLPHSLTPSLSSCHIV